jgi:hypothetical protein
MCTFEYPNGDTHTFYKNNRLRSVHISGWGEAVTKTHVVYDSQDEYDSIKALYESEAKAWRCMKYDG